MVAMDLLEAIDVRRSRRKYEPVPLPADAVKTLEQLTDATQP